MRVRLMLLSCALLAVAMSTPEAAEAFVFIHEIFADPATGLAGDANGDGVRDSADDEFVELFNDSLQPVDLSSWSLTDATATRHVFASGTFIDPNGLFVVYGGGQPNVPGVKWQTATGGQLNLNNTAETVSLLDAQGHVIDAVTYGAEAGSDQSIVRSPEGTKGAFVKHTALENANGQLFSPGAFVNFKPATPVETPNPSSPGEDGTNAVPEPATMLSLMSGLGSMVWMRKRGLKR